MLTYVQVKDKNYFWPLPDFRAGPALPRTGQNPGSELLASPPTTSMRHPNLPQSPLQFRWPSFPFAKNRRADEVRESSSALRRGEMRVTHGDPQRLKNWKTLTHLLWTPSGFPRGIDAPVRDSFQLCVPLFYRRDVKHRLCQGQSSRTKIFRPALQVIVRTGFARPGACLRCSSRQGTVCKLVCKSFLVAL
jgi:hypothetical protein